MLKISYLLILLPLLVNADEIYHPRNVKLAGELEQRVRLTEKRFHHAPFDLDLIVQDIARRPELKRRFEEYEGDVSGRTLGCWSYISRLLSEHPQKLDSIFNLILPHQATAGFFGQDQQKIDWDYWGRQTFGHGRLLGGLVQYYHLTADERALKSAEKLGDYFVKNIPIWTQTYDNNPWSNKSDWVSWQDNTSNRQHFVKTHMTSILESLMMLHDISAKHAYLDAGAEIVKHFPEFGHYHSHSYMNTIVGMAMLYEKTGDHSLLNQLYNTYWQDIVRHSSPIDGGMREWFPEDNRTEGCSVTDWIRLNLAMWNITRDAVYLDEAENAWLNALNFHQTANGAFGHATCSANGYEPAYSESWWCCTMHGLWAYADIIQNTAAANDDNLWFNFYAPMSFNLGANESTEFSIKTDYPTDGFIKIECRTKTSFSRTTHLRVPQWAEAVKVLLNGKPVNGSLQHGYFTFDHAWKSGDNVSINFPMSLRIVDYQGNDILKRRHIDADPLSGCFFYGPLLLASQSNSKQELPVELRFDPQKKYKTEAKKGPFVIDAHFTMPSSINASIFFDTYATLRPISEITGTEDWTDEWNNFRRNSEKPINRPFVQIWHKIKIQK
jgi:DUF1680 family protein